MPERASFILVTVLVVLAAAAYLVAVDTGGAPGRGSTRPSSDTSAGETAPGTAASPRQAAPGDADAGATRVPGMPDSLFLRRGACPFECCIYREWVAERPIAVSSTEGSRADTLFTIAPGETFAAVTGNVHVLGVERVAVTAPVETFVTGDTLVVLDYVGEGYYNVWHDGQVRQVPQFWSDEDWQPENAPGHSIGSRDTEWWVQARNGEGSVGWFEMTDSVSVRGSDQCA